MATKKKAAAPKKTEHKKAAPTATIIQSKGAAYAEIPVVKPKPPKPKPVADATLKAFGISRPSKVKNQQWRQQHGLDPNDKNI